MFWSEEENKDQFTAPDNVWDVTFKVSCKQIKLDHAWPLTQAISEMIPWLFDEPQAAIHHIYILALISWKITKEIYGLERLTEVC